VRKMRTNDGKDTLYYWNAWLGVHATGRGNETDQFRSHEFGTSQFRGGRRLVVLDVHRDAYL